jgi:hypothetical protein
MTDEQINVAITEATGLWDHPYSSDTRVMMDFCRDLNAMHEAEHATLQGLENVYANMLGRVTKADDSCELRFFCATARQRAEAFLRTLGKWEDGE